MLDAITAMLTSLAALYWYSDRHDVIERIRSWRDRRRANRALPAARVLSLPPARAHPVPIRPEPQLASADDIHRRIAILRRDIEETGSKFTVGRWASVYQLGREGPVTFVRIAEPVPELAVRTRPVPGDGMPRSD